MSTPHLITDEQRRARLAHRHLLAAEARTDDVPAIADGVVALHSSDPASVYLSAIARMAEPSVASVSAALHDDRSLVRHHGMRRTLWVATQHVIRSIHAACTVDVAATEHRRVLGFVAASGIDDPEAWVRQAKVDTLAALHRLGPSTARALGKKVPALTTKLLVGSGKYVTEQSAHTRLLLDLGFSGEIVRTVTAGSWLSSEYEWSLTTDWLGETFTGADPVAARADLAARYLRRFGPVATADLQWWAGWTAGATKAALAANDAVQVLLENGATGWLLPDDLDPVTGPDPWVALLPGLDPTAMGWKERGWCYGEFGAFGGPLFDRNGNVGPTIWLNGQAVGAWTQRKDGSIATETLVPLPARTAKALTAQAERLQVAIGDARVTPRFPTPLQQQLAGR